jgi:hypothetical protein
MLVERKKLKSRGLWAVLPEQLNTYNQRFLFFGKKFPE